MRANTSTTDYAVADFVGRCFLRVCYWFDVCTSWTKRYRAPELLTSSTALNSVATVAATPSLPESVATIRVQSTSDLNRSA